MSSEDPPVVAASGVGKCYTLYDRPSHRMADLLFSRWHKRGRPFWALRGLDLQLARGECVGIVGRNGAGKSTFLQLICGTLTPTEGALAVRGRVAALLELGAGFNPDFSGRENARLNAALMGLTRREVDERLGEIIEFAEIGEFIDQPVKHYSSGMFVRLAFSVATAVNPDLLVIDEALSVGDGAFSRKSFDRIMKLKDAGAAVLFCSHSMYQVEVLCSRALWIEGGRLRMDGPAGEVTAAYQASLNAAAASLASDRPQARWQAAPHGSGAISRVTPRVNGREARGDIVLRSGRDTLALDLEFIIDPALPVPTLAIGLSDKAGLTVSSALSSLDGVQLQRDARGRGSGTLTLDAVPLLKGEYAITAFLLSEQAMHLYDQVNDCVRFRIVDDGPEQGLVRLPHRWHPRSAGALPGSLGTWTPRTLTIAGRPLLLREVEENDSKAVVSLHRQVFSSQVDDAWFQWKYVSGRGLAVGLWDDGELVAFCGGVPRPLAVQGRATPGLQICDVMVTRRWRGVLTRQGPFFQVSRALYGHALGAGLQFGLGFGFPSQRHIALAGKLDLLRDAGPMWALTWPASSPGADDAVVDWCEMPLEDARLDATVDAAWGAMAESARDLTIGERSARQVRWRHFARPGAAPARLLLLRRGSPPAPWGVAVLSAPVDADARVQWLDWIGPPTGCAAALQAVRAAAAARGAGEVWAWASSEVLAALQRHGPASAQPQVTEVARIGVPCAADPDLDASALRGWWMGADTDFL